MTKPSNLSPSEALQARDARPSDRSGAVRWALRAAGAGILVAGWLAVSLQDIGSRMFVTDTIVFVGMGVYAFIAATLSRRSAVAEERKLRLRLLVHNMELENISMRDQLTQLFNRRFLFERMEREFQTAKEFQRPLAFIALELRSLDRINHTHGYAAGDRVLAAVGQFLMGHTRATDIPARMGDNRFGVILPDTSKSGAYTMVERLAHALSTLPLTGEESLDASVVVSFGVSGYPWSGDSVDGLIRQAEVDMAGAGRAAFDQRQEDAPDPDDLDIPAAFRKSGEQAIDAGN